MTLTAKLARVTMDTARLSDEQLLSLGFTQAEIDAGAHLPGVSGGVNSTTAITDLNTVITNLSTTQQARAVSASNPMMDLTGNLKLCVLKFQEVVGLLNYILYGNMAGSQGGAVTIGAPGGPALLQSNDTNHTTTYDLAVGVLNDLS
jgi:hypothetical protein